MYFCVSRPSENRRCGANIARRQRSFATAIGRPVGQAASFYNILWSSPPFLFPVRKHLHMGFALAATQCIDFQLPYDLSAGLITAKYSGYDGRSASGVRLILSASHRPRKCSDARLRWGFRSHFPFRLATFSLHTTPGVVEPCITSCIRRFCGDVILRECVSTTKLLETTCTVRGTETGGGNNGRYFE